MSLRVVNSRINIPIDLIPTVTTIKEVNRLKVFVAGKMVSPGFISDAQGIQNICYLLKFSHRTVMTHMADLVKIGWVGHRTGTTTYYFRSWAWFYKKGMIYNRDAAPAYVLTKYVHYAQIDRYRLPNDITSLHDISTEGIDSVDYAVNFMRNVNGSICFGFGKHKNKHTSTELEYMKWMLRNDYTSETKMIIKNLFGVNMSLKSSTRFIIYSRLFHITFALRKKNNAKKMDITNPLSKVSADPLEFFLTTYTKDALNLYVNQLKITFEAEYEALNPLQWSDAELKYTYTSFNEDGIEFKHENYLAEILEDDLYDRSVLSIELIHQEYKNANKFGGLDSVDNYTQYLQDEISKCTALIAKISSFKFVEILYQPLNNIAEAISIYNKDIDLPSNEKTSIASVLFEWNVDIESVKFVLSKLLHRLLIDKGLIHRSTRSRNIAKAFGGSANKSYLNIQWLALNPKNSEISISALFFFIHSLSYKELIKGNYPEDRSTSRKLHTIFSKSDGSEIPLIALNRAKNDYNDRRYSPSAHTSNRNFLKIQEIIEQLETSKNSLSGIR